MSPLLLPLTAVFSFKLTLVLREVTGTSGQDACSVVEPMLGLCSDLTD